jgi:hypothetical protein
VLALSPLKHISSRGRNAYLIRGAPAHQSRFAWTGDEGASYTANSRQIWRNLRDAFHIPTLCKRRVDRSGSANPMTVSRLKSMARRSAA